MNGKKLYDTYMSFMNVHSIGIDEFEVLGESEQAAWADFEMEVALQGWKPEL